ncbi:MAG: N-formylglutamate amidohydrolase [Deltaproteobacteria bacterium]|nr:N-formylglutamate amidohydrolase [Deltaproteobacteria bacterium]MBW1961253.1 N-formylglutamate amidohydrolase [Deltaproteobacteria bacterium]
MVDYRRLVHRIPGRFRGTRVYRSTPTDAMNRRSIKKYAAFNRFIAAVIKVLLNRFGACVIYDIHSYNIKHQVDKGHPSPPMFNLGTLGIQRNQWKRPIAAWLDHLRQIKIPELPTTIAENDVFGGMGEFCIRLTGWDANILVLPTEISKFYMDEHSGIVYDSLVHALKKEVAMAVTAHGGEFQRYYCR